MMNPGEHYDRLHDHMMAIARERDWLLVQVDKWRNIAGNLYDEMRLRAADCLYRHEDATKDCVKDYELADELSGRGDKQ
jgi:hypothetical protein